MESKLYNNPAVVRDCLQGECNSILRISDTNDTVHAPFSVECDFNVDEVLSENVVRREGSDPHTFSKAESFEVIPRNPVATTSAGFLRGLFS